MKKANNIQKAKVQSQGVAYVLHDFFVNFNLVLLIKVLLIKKSVCFFFSLTNQVSKFNLALIG